MGVTVLYANGKEVVEMRMLKTHGESDAIYNNINHIKYLGMNHVKDVEGLYIENYKLLFRERKESLHK